MALSVRSHILQCLILTRYAAYPIVPPFRSFGFGLMDAEKMVALARSWTAVPAQRVCELRPDPDEPLSGAAAVSSALTVNGDACAVGRLEHVRVNLTVLARRRGAVRVELASPMGTVSKIIPKR